MAGLLSAAFISMDVYKAPGAVVNHASREILCQLYLHQTSYNMNSLLLTYSAANMCLETSFFHFSSSLSLHQPFLKVCSSHIHTDVLADNHINYQDYGVTVLVLYDFHDAENMDGVQ